MIATASTDPPAWLDRAAYPFASHWLDLPVGRMHYVDEGHGRPVLFVHGTPTWSFLYRRLLLGLRDGYRCIAPDNLGFGLSAKPAGWSYTPEAHSQNLALLVERLGLRDLVLVVHDFGGPIGLPYALDHPENVAGVVVLNTWMWSTRGSNPRAEPVIKLLGTGFGRLLYERLNLSVRVELPMLWSERAKLTPALHRQYLGPMDSPQARHGSWVLARELLGSSPWFASLWQRRAALATLPALLAWGQRDPLLGAEHLLRWQQALPQATTVLLEAGHFVQEAAPEELLAAVSDFLAGLP